MDLNLSRLNQINLKNEQNVELIQNLQKKAIELNKELILKGFNKKIRIFDE